MDRVLLSHALYKDGMDVLEGKVEMIIANNGKSDEIIEELKKADGFILRIGKIDRKAIEACPGLRVITRTGVGCDNVDLKAATENGIPVIFCPTQHARAVAEHTLAMIFALSKNLIESHNETVKGNFNVRNKYQAVDVRSKTVSVVGFGNIGKELASLCKGIGMDVLVCDSLKKKEMVEAKGYRFTDSLNEAISAADYLSLSIPYRPETRHIISRAQFDLMKKSAFFLNCARGELVNEKDLYDALYENRIAGAAIDVMQVEPIQKDNPLLSLDNIIVTPHMAPLTKETTAEIVKIAAEGTLAVLNGQKWPYVANPEVYDHPKWKS